MNVQVELSDVLRVTKGWFQWKSEMRGETLDREHLCVFRLHALRAVRVDWKNFGGESRLAFVFIVLLKQARINHLLLNLAIDCISSVLLHHHAGNACVVVPDGEVRNGRIGRQGE